MSAKILKTVQNELKIINLLDKKSLEFYKKSSELFNIIKKHSVSSFVLSSLEDSEGKNIQLRLKECLKILRYNIHIFEENYYINWIKEKQYNTVIKSDHLANKFSCYQRKYNFTLLSYSDPLTNDEIKYILNFYNEINKTNIKKIEEISLKESTKILLNLLTN